MKADALASNFPKKTRLLDRPRPLEAQEKAASEGTEGGKSQAKAKRPKAKPKLRPSTLQVFFFVFFCIQKLLKSTPRRV